MVKNSYSLLWLWKFARKNWLGFLALGGLSCLMACSSLGVSFIIKGFVDISTGDSIWTIGQLVAIAALVMFLLGLAYIGSSLIEGYTYSAIEKRVRTLVMTELFRKHFLKVQNWHSGDILTRITMDVQAIAEVFPAITGSMFSHIILAVMGVVALFLLSWQMALVLLFAMPLMILAVGAISPFLQKAVQKDLGHEEHNRSYMQEVLNKFLLFRSYSMRGQVCDKLQLLYDKKINSKMSVSLINGILGFAQSFLGMGMFVIALGAGTYFVLRGDVTVGSLIAMVQLVNYIVAPISNIQRWSSTLNSAKVSAVRIGEILDIPSEQLIERLSKADKITRLELQSVSFGYPEQEELCLQDANFSAEAGEIVCIFGESGSGKSTLLKIIMGLYSIASGEICYFIDDSRIENIDVVASCAYVPSDDFLFDGTLAENICMSAPADFQRLHDVVTSANIGEFVYSHPQQFDYHIHEGGKNLSMGQRQRIAIARALYKNASVLIFDEPTANLDHEAKQLFYRTLRNISDDTICIVVTHDQGMVNVCDSYYHLVDRQLIKAADCFDKAPNM